MYPRSTTDLHVIAKLADAPNDADGLTAEALKDKFDESGLAVQRYLNDELLPALEAARSVAFPLTLAPDAWEEGTQTVRDARLRAEGCAYTVAPRGDCLAAYTACGVYAEDVTADGAMTFRCRALPAAPLTVRILRMEVDE